MKKTTVNITLETTAPSKSPALNHRIAIQPARGLTIIQRHPMRGIYKGIPAVCYQVEHQHSGGYYQDRFKCLFSLHGFEKPGFTRIKNQNKVYMNGASALPLLNTISRPSSKKMTIMGISHHFFFPSYNSRSLSKNPCYYSFNIPVPK